jgi:CBS domain-containing protein
MERVLVADLMTRDPIKIKPSASLLDCAKMMVKQNVGSLLIEEDKKLKGIISQDDILWALVKKSKDDLDKIRAIDISPKKIATLRPFMTINEAIKKMKQFKFERFPVVHEGNLVGMITARDILTFHPEFYPELEEFSRIREESQKLQRLKELKNLKEVEGICEECGEVATLRKTNGMMICESCSDSI